MELAPNDIVFAESEPLSDAELNTLFGGAWPHHEPHDFQRVLDRSLVYVTARIDGRLVGFVNVATDGGAHAFLLDPTVAPDVQRHGIGTALVQHAVGAAADRGAEWVHVDYVPELDAFYRKAGFRPTTAGLVRTVGAAEQPDSNDAANDAATDAGPFARMGATSLLLLSLLGGSLSMGIGAVALDLRLELDIAAMMALFYFGAALFVALRISRAGVRLSALVGPPLTTATAKLTVVAVPLGALSIAGFWLLFLPVSYLAPAYVRNYLARSDAHPTTDLASWAGMAVVAVIVAPVLEELFFRGLLMQRWAHKWGTLPGVLASSALFAVCHFEILGHFLFGIVMCALYLRTRSLWVPIAAHALNNLLASLGGLGGVFQPAKRDELTLASFQSQWWVGLVLLVAGVALLEVYRRKYWRDVSLMALLTGPVPYSANLKA